jgi:tetratricopeptide (TPR) repeat protein
MNAYGEGLQTEAAVQKALSISTPELDVQYAAWLKQQIAKMGLDDASKTKLELLKQKGAELLKAKDYPQALQTWEQAYAVSPVDPTVHERLAGLYLSKAINQPEKALPHLHALDAQQLKDNRFSIRLARLYEDLKRPNDAVLCARRATEINPYDLDAREIYARVLQQSGNPTEAEAQQKIVQTLSANER